MSPAAPVIRLEGVSFAYPGSEQSALEDVSLQVAAGERLGILGPNGGGKSTLLKVILGLLTPTRGEAWVMGRSARLARRSGLVGYVPQKLDADLALPISVREMVTLGASWRLPAWRGVPAEVRDRVGGLLALVGAEAFADRPIGSLSGGQMQRALIARALAARPRVLALDEPTVGIDAPGQRQFADLLERVHAELNLTVLIISHDLRAIAAGCDRVACLARRLHSHVSPTGLTPEVLAEVFSHDVAGFVGSLGAVHVHAHRAEDCPGHHHGHDGQAVNTPTREPR